MPYVTVDHTPDLADVLEADLLARTLHELLIPDTPSRHAGAVPATRLVLRPVTTAVAGDPAGPFVHVAIALPWGRTDNDKARLARTVLAKLRGLLPAGSPAPAVSVELRDLDGSFAHS